MFRLHDDPFFAMLLVLNIFVMSFHGVIHKSIDVWRILLIRQFDGLQRLASVIAVDAHHTEQHYDYGNVLGTIEIFNICVLYTL